MILTESDRESLGSMDVNSGTDANDGADIAPKAVNSVTASERRFNLNGFTYAAQLWGEEGGLPFIALHGWLDNSASFDVLAPQLDGIQCLALDLAGQGFSDHQPGWNDYPVWSEVAAIYEIADQMGWQQFGLIGHSRGAMMSLLIAGVYPERVSHLIMIDSLLPPLVEPGLAAERMVDSLKETRFRVSRPLSLYPSYEEAIRARCLSRFAGIGKEAAMLLAKRGLREVDGQFHWHADGKLWAPSRVAMSSDMFDCFLRKVTAKALLLVGEDGLSKKLAADPNALADHQQAIEVLLPQVYEFAGGHFLHMEEPASQVASAIAQFVAGEQCVEPIIDAIDMAQD